MLGNVIKTKKTKMPMPKSGTGNTHHSRHEKRGCAAIMVLRILFYDLIITIRYLSWSINYC